MISFSYHYYLENIIHDTIETAETLIIKNRDLLFLFELQFQHCHHNFQARVAVELQFQEVKIEKDKKLEQLSALLEEETQAKKDEEIVRNLQAR